MLLAIDVGNTQTHVGAFSGEQLTEHWRFQTRAGATSDELAERLSGLMELRGLGFDSDNPWEEWANSGGDADTLLNGWLLAHADKPARIPEEHSETPYMTRRAMEFIGEAGAD